MTLVGRHNPLFRIGRGLMALVRPRRRGGRTRHPAWVIAHRGAARIAPENTIEAFERAMALGADAIEADICVTKDGHFVVWHDADPAGEVALARQSGGEELAYVPDVPPIGSPWRRSVSDLTLEEFHRYYGYCRRRGGLADVVATSDPPEVPAITLEALFAWADGEARLEHVCLDVKLLPSQRNRTLDLLELARDRVTRAGARKKLAFHYLSPQREVLEALLEHCSARPLPPRLDVHADFELPGVLRFARKLGCRHASMGMGRRLWNEFRAEAARATKARDEGWLDSLIVWTINEPSRLRELVALGVDGIVTDDPAALREIVSGSVASRPSAEAGHDHA
ncbi:MAG TPA: glycerophosphodiester phosphodiesterase family protein [Thermoanaerobaculia bacterium]|nr:glycerophosphodiester phosphodiesterase family protein [Thermoanaerobaculia bacterium]